MQERHNSIANALELRLSCTNTWIWFGGWSLVGSGHGVVRPVQLVIYSWLAVMQTVDVICDLKACFIYSQVPVSSQPSFTGSEPCDLCSCGSLGTPHRAWSPGNVWDNGEYRKTEKMGSITGSAIIQLLLLLTNTAFLCSNCSLFLTCVHALFWAE